MAYIQESLSKGEEIHEIYKLHWFSKMQMVFWAILSILTFGLPFEVTIPAFCFTFLLAIYEWLRLRFLEQGSTNKRVIMKSGIISRNTEEMKIGSIETIEIKQSIFGRIFGFGDVKKSIESVEPV